MSNILDNGTVLPFGLLGPGALMSDAHKKTYQNFGLKMGIVINSYPKKDAHNISKSVPEYDVMAFESNEDGGSTTITYKNCVAMSSLGSIADFFEADLRKLKNKTSKGSTPNPSKQNGSIVLLLCLNGLSDKAVIIGSLSHPDRPTTLTGDGPRLEGEYNGVNIKVEEDGSTSLTFKGATDNDGKAVDSSQGNTVLSIEKDGTFQMKHKGVTQRHEKKGDSSLTAEGNISNTAKKNFNVTASENINIKATKNMSAEVADLIMKATGSASLQFQKLEMKVDSDMNVKASQIQMEAESLAQIKGSSIVLDGNVALGGPGGQPVLIMSTMFIGTGNLGIPVISNAISGFATKVTAT